MEEYGNLRFKEGQEESKPKWISLKDRLPDQSGLVLILVDEVTQYIAFYKRNHNKFTAYGVRSVEINDFNTTHWMDLPEVPLCEHYNIGSRCQECNFPL